MATKDEHLRQAASNESLASILAKGAHKDWAVTVYFYSALHYVQALLAVHKNVCENQDERNAAMYATPQLRKVQLEYRLLQSLSRQARYDALPIGATEVAKAEEFFLIVRGQIRYVMGIKD